MEKQPIIVRIDTKDTVAWIDLNKISLIFESVEGDNFLLIIGIDGKSLELPMYTEEELMKKKEKLVNLWSKNGVVIEKI